MCNWRAFTFSWGGPVIMKVIAFGLFFNGSRSYLRRHRDEAEQSLSHFSSVHLCCNHFVSWVTFRLISRRISSPLVLGNFVLCGCITLALPHLTSFEQTFSCRVAQQWMELGRCHGLGHKLQSGWNVVDAFVVAISLVVNAVEATYEGHHLMWLGALRALRQRRGCTGLLCYFVTCVEHLRWPARAASRSPSSVLDSLGHVLSSPIFEHLQWPARAAGRPPN
eukprot:scaffold50750_cov20-Tisochrysis_lutea.AAC.1